MDKTLKRTFIPPALRPKIRGTQLRHGPESRHYLTIFNNSVRRHTFLQQVIRQCRDVGLSQWSQKDHINNEPREVDAVAFDLEGLFGVEKNLFLELMADLQGAQREDKS